jgi:hypothetical protein
MSQSVAAEAPKPARASWPVRLRESFDAPLPRLRLVHAAWLFGIFAYFLPAATWSPVSRFDLTRAVVEQHQLSIDAFADNTGDRARAGGHWYSDKAPLVALLAAPAYQIYHLADRSRGKSPSYTAEGSADRPALRVSVNRSFQRGLYVCSLATSGVAGVALGLVLFELLRRRASVLAALSGSTIAVLCTPVLPYATSFYGHVPAAAFLAGAALALDVPPDASRISSLTDDSCPSPRRVSVAGACLALSVGCEYLALVPALVWVAVLLWKRPLRDGLRLVGRLAIGAGAPALLLGAYHAACFGAPWRTGYSFIVDPQFAAGHESGLLGIRLPRLDALWGLTFGRLRGLFYVAPITLLLAAGLAAGARRRDRTELAALLGAIALLLVNASYYMWWGGVAAAPRHLIPVIALLGLGTTALWVRPRLRYGIAALAAVSACSMLLTTAVGLEAPERGDVLFDFVYERALRGQLALLSGASNLGLELGWIRGGSLGPLCAWLMIGAHWLYVRACELDRVVAGQP